MTGIVEVLTSEAERVAEREGCTLVDLTYRKEQGRWVLRVLVDKIGAEGRSSVGFQECQAISDHLSGVLDVRDIVPNAYHLEVSSPGINRPLKRQADYERAVGQLVRLQTRVPLDHSEGRRRFKGRLVRVAPEWIDLQVDPENRKREAETLCRIPFSMIQKAHIDFEF